MVTKKYLFVEILGWHLDILYYSEVQEIDFALRYKSGSHWHIVVFKVTRPLNHKGNDYRWQGLNTSFFVQEITSQYVIIYSK